MHRSGVAGERADFARLAEVLKTIKGRFILSINDVPEIREMFAWATIEEVKVSYTIGDKADRAPVRGELVIESNSVPSGSGRR